MVVPIRYKATNANMAFLLNTLNFRLFTLFTFCNRVKIHMYVSKATLWCHNFSTCAPINATIQILSRYQLLTDSGPQSDVPQPLEP